ncbi:MAG TPA: MFS transporter [Solirubrobacteraceae bacterium]|jgi:MFS family permease
MFSRAIQNRVTALTPGTSVRLRLAYALFLLAGVASAAIVPLLPRLADRYGLSTSATALLLGLPGLATLAVSVPAGLAADRLGARRVTLGASALLVVSCVLQAAPSLIALLLGRVVFGIAFGVVWTSGMAWVADFDGGGGSRLGPTVTCSSVGVMAGPAVGGILGQHVGLGAPFAAIAVAVGMVTIPLALGSAASQDAPGAGHQRAPAGGPEPDAAPGHPVSARSLLALVRRPVVGAAAAALAISGAVASSSQLLISGGLHHLGMSTDRIGLAFSAAAICYIAVSAGVVRLGRRVRTLRFNALAAVMLALALVPALAGGGAFALVAALMISAAPRAAIGTIAYSLAAGDSAQPAGGEGFVFGMLNGAWAAATVLMPLLAGALEQSHGARAGFLAVIIPSCALAAWLVARATGGESGGGGRVRRPRVRLGWLRPAASSGLYRGG